MLRFAGATPSRGAVFAAALLFSTFSPLASSAELSGVVVDDAGAPLARAPVCLRETLEDPACLKLRFTDKKGGYSFNGLKRGNYSLSIFSDRSAAARKFDEYKTYVWSPVQQSVSIAGDAKRVAGPDFIGKFNFSNYQRVIELTASDFPEFAQIDLGTATYFLKVSFQVDSANETPPETVFLGQVGDATRLLVSASIPLAVTTIDYEIFGADFAASGSIDLGN
jgi:hypothetical protein